MSLQDNTPPRPLTQEQRLTNLEVNQTQTLSLLQQLSADLKSIKEGKTTNSQPTLPPEGNPGASTSSTTNTAGTAATTIIANNQDPANRAPDKLFRKSPVNLREKIWSFQYVDLQSLIPTTKGSGTAINLFKDEEKVTFEERKKPNQNNSIQIWQQAFMVYAAVLTTKHPNHTTELFQYCHNITQHALIHPWQKLYDYDIAFRQEVEDDPSKSWAHLDNILFTGEISSVTNVLHNSPFKNNHSDTRPATKSNEPCKKFNSGYCTHGTRCKHQHKCTCCGIFNHPATKCRVKKSGKQEWNHFTSTSKSEFNCKNNDKQ